MAFALPFAFAPASAFAAGLAAGRGEGSEPGAATLGGAPPLPYKAAGAPMVSLPCSAPGSDTREAAGKSGPPSSGPAGGGSSGVDGSASGWDRVWPCSGTAAASELLAPLAAAVLLSPIVGCRSSVGCLTCRRRNFWRWPCNLDWRGLGVVPRKCIFCQRPSYRFVAGSVNLRASPLQHPLRGQRDPLLGGVVRVLFEKLQQKNAHPACIDQGSREIASAVYWNSRCWRCESESRADSCEGPLGGPSKHSGLLARLVAAQVLLTSQYHILCVRIG